MIELASLFAFVFALNVIPAFAPPTWMALSWVGFNYPSANPFLLAVVSACAATLGRLVLARLSHLIIRQRLISDATRDNIDSLKDRLDRHRSLSFGVFLLYAFSPFPSNFLFIAYGLTSLPMWLVAVPFFIGRCVSYSFFVFTASALSRALMNNAADSRGYFGIYFVVTQLLFLAAIFVLAKVDWRHAFAVRKFRWLRDRPEDKP
jgi:uncharacterized membrane protein YdjX (TVP38/TMEM64 family)